MMLKIRTKCSALLLLLVIITSSLPSSPALADAGGETSPWAGVFDDQGHMLPGVVDLGEVEVEASWMDLGIPGILEINPTFHQYLTTQGDTLLVPSASTLFFMGLSPVESGLMNVYDSLQNGQGIAITGTTLLVHLMSQTISGQALLAEIGEFGYTDPDAFADDLIHDKQKMWAMGGTDILNIMMELMTTGFGDNMLATTYLLYLKEDCSACPTGCPADLCQLVPQACPEAIQVPSAPSDPACPASTVTVGTPTLSIVPVAPEYPLASLQDPARRGVDLVISVIIPPTVEVVYTAVPRYEEITRCAHPVPLATTAPNCRTNQSQPGYDGILISSLEKVGMDCRRVVHVYPEPITSVSASATLSPQSRDWIERELAAYYPGAKVLAPFLSLVPGVGTVASACAPDGSCRAGAELKKVQFLDPGTHNLTLTAQSAGTPVSAGRILRQSGQVMVGLISVRLVSVGSR